MESNPLALMQVGDRGRRISCPKDLRNGPAAVPTWISYGLRQVNVGRWALFFEALLFVLGDAGKRDQCGFTQGFQRKLE